MLRWVLLLMHLLLWVCKGDVVCYSGTTITNNNTCTPCPDGYACPVDTMRKPQLVPWVTKCGAGMYLQGSNNATHIANCSPCPIGFACPLGNDAEMVRWTLHCPKGTFPRGRNTAVEVVNCTSCVSNSSRCPASNASNVTGKFVLERCEDGWYEDDDETPGGCTPCGIPGKAPFACVGRTRKDWMVRSCPAGTIKTGSNNATHVVECLECPPQKACVGGREAIPWVLGCKAEAGYFLKGSNNATHVAECVECPANKSCTGYGTIVRDWVYACDSPGYYVDVGDNNSTHVAKCKLCPWNYSCVNKTSALRVPWVWECPAGSYGVGANTKNSTARCKSPCPVAYHACMGNKATIVSSDPLLEDGYEVSFLSTGIVPWTTYCPRGTYPDANNTASSVTRCLPCPPGYACVNESIALAKDNYLFFYTWTHHVTSCPPLFHISGDNNSTHVAKCVRSRHMNAEDERIAIASPSTRSFQLELQLYGDSFVYDIMARSQVESAIISALRMYPSRVHVYDMKKEVHNSVIIRSVVVVPRQDAAYMLDLGDEGVLSGDYMVNFFEFEIGYLGLMIDLIRPQRDAVGVWFVELDDHAALMEEDMVTASSAIVSLFRVCNSIIVCILIVTLYVILTYG